MSKDERALNEEQAEYLARLRAALARGESSGPSTPSDFDAFIEMKRQRGSWNAKTEALNRERI
jgi:Arc/MetJ-type ribon-helix-helix transcriptional regulator